MTGATRPLILLAGGAGFIGLHVAVELIGAGYDVLIVDDFANAWPDSLEGVASIAGRAPLLERCDLRSRFRLDAIFARRKPAAAVLLAGLKSAPASVRDPVRYYDVNVGGALALLSTMLGHGVTRLVFSSTAIVYRPGEPTPFTEQTPIAPNNPYGRTKLMIEQTLADTAESWPAFRAVSLRYFNPVGAHPSGAIAERPRAATNNLFPRIAEAATGGRMLTLFGDDYPTPDGFCVRDFIHVSDLARGHVAALDRLLDASADWPGHRAVNLGRGRGCSVREAVCAFERAAGRRIPFEVAPRRPGDVMASVADPTLAVELFGWRAERDLDEMCRDLWRGMNPAARPSPPASAARA